MLEKLGWNEERLNENGTIPHAVLGRVSHQSKELFTVFTEKGSWLCTLPGSYSVRPAFPFPATGDWVMVEQMPGEERGIIQHVFERKSAFIRKVAGQETKQQVIATNVDYVFLVMSCNDDFNVRRLERYLIAAWDSGSTPVILLMKADLADQAQRIQLTFAIEEAAYGVPVHFVSSKTGENLDVVKGYLQPNKTGVLLGSSGVGKSTLVNQLIGAERMETQEIREDDGKGRHTTTRREMLLLPDGGVIIDTPGMRELQLWHSEDQAGLREEFSDIEALAQECKFRNCQHHAEPGCAVNRAIEEGVLSQSRYDSYVKLQKELAYVARKNDINQQLREKEKWKDISKLQKKMYTDSRKRLKD